jgi:hypothetical protein
VLAEMGAEEVRFDVQIVAKEVDGIPRKILDDEKL